MHETNKPDADPVIDRAVTVIREERYARDAARAALLHRLSDAQSQPRILNRWSWRVRTSWAAAGILAAAVTLLVTRSGTKEDPAPAAVPAALSHLVQFSLEAPEAQRVTLVGEFNQWNDAATPMRRSSGGRWTAAVPLTPGRHLYSFAVDNRAPILDPTAPVAPEQSFGVRHSVIVVPGSGQ